MTKFGFFPLFDISLRRCLLVVAIFTAVLAVDSPTALAASVPAYGEVVRFGGLDSSAKYEATSTTGLKEAGEAKFVDPVGMAVDTKDPNAPDEYAIYVLDLLNPQALKGFDGELEPFTTLKLEYRIQKLGDRGEVLKSRKFTLESSATAPDIRAVALAVDGPGDRVYVLLSDVPPTANNASGANAAYAIDAWTAGRAGDEALAPVGELVGPATLQPGGTSTLVGDIQGESLVVDVTAGGTDLALGGNEYTDVEPEEGSSTPIIERVATSGGAVVGTPWEGSQDLQATEDAGAKFWDWESTELYALSAEPGGALNATLGPEVTNPFGLADEEPNMATIAPELSTTTAVLPWASAAEDSTVVSNYDRAATVMLFQDMQPQHYNRAAPTGASVGGSTLAPSVVQLDGEGQKFPSELYAGVVAQSPQEGGGIDLQSTKAFSWVFAKSEETTNAHGEKEAQPVAPASLAIRVFDAQGESLAMIGNTVAGGACNLQGGPFGESFYHGSFAALAPGRDGVLFALVQPDLDSQVRPYPLTPNMPIGGGAGDQVVEFAPGAGQNGAAGQECPQPTGGFTITNETQHEPPSAGSGPVTVLAGTTLKLDASEVNLQGGAPWAYDWESGAGTSADEAWQATNNWAWPSPVAEFTYAHSGSYTAKLRLVNDFGALEAQRKVEVAEAGKPTACFKATQTAAGQPVSFDASCTSHPQFDSVKAYQWEFGDGQGESHPSAQAQHEYAATSSYTVKLTITDALGQKASTTQSVAYTAAQSGQHEEPKAQPKNEESKAQPKSEAPKGEVKPAPKAKPPLTKAQKLANALKACKKKSKRQRKACEKQARKKYGPAAKKKKKSKKK